MALTFTNLDFGDQTFDPGPLDFDSDTINPPSNALLLVAVQFYLEGGTESAPTLAGVATTWTPLHNIAVTGASQLYTYVGEGPFSSGVINFSHASSLFTGFAFILDQVTGTVGAETVGAGDTSAANGEVTVTLASFAN